MPKQEMGRDLSAGVPSTSGNIGGIERGEGLSADKQNFGSQPKAALTHYFEVPQIGATATPSPLFDMIGKESA